MLLTPSNIICPPLQAGQELLSVTTETKARQIAER